MKDFESVVQDRLLRLFQRAQERGETLSNEERLTRELRAIIRTMERFAPQTIERKFGPVVLKDGRYYVGKTLLVKHPHVAVFAFALIGRVERLTLLGDWLSMSDTIIPGAVR